MRPHDPANFRRLIRHRCQYCGRDFFADKQTGRPRLFCDKKCKDGEFRRLRYLTLKNVETPLESVANSKVSKVDSGDRPSVLIGPTDPPVNIFGGRRWNGRPRIDRELVTAIIATEIDGYDSGEADMPVVASDSKIEDPADECTVKGTRPREFLNADYVSLSKLARSLTGSSS
jgi:hypothetical protein